MITVLWLFRSEGVVIKANTHVKCTRYTTQNKFCLLLSKICLGSTILYLVMCGRVLYINRNTDVATPSLQK